MNTPEPEPDEVYFYSETVQALLKERDLDPSKTTPEDAFPIVVNHHIFHHIDHHAGGPVAPSFDVAVHDAMKAVGLRTVRDIASLVYEAKHPETQAD